MPISLTEKDVRYVAELAHLHLTKEEMEQFQPQLAAILEYMQKLNQLDTTGVEPMAQVLAPGVSNSSLRGDKVVDCFPQDVALANAPDSDAGLFKVPSVIERE
jgi:aspartyl-tRNA(Asn)/glutamyl-tRNA(Gln) amidotransferase subunit C